MLANSLAAAGDSAAAETVLRRAQQRYPGDVWINYDLANTLEKLARREEAIRYYTAARSLRPETAHELAHALQKKGEKDEAIAVFEDLRRRQPENGWHLGCLGRALKNQGRSKEAGATLEAAAAANREAIRLRPDDASAHFNLGYALNEQGKLAEAIAEYRTVIRIQPDNAYAHNNLGWALQGQGKLDEAIAEYRTAIRIQPGYDWGRNNLAWVLAKSPDRGPPERSEALELARKAVALSPKEGSFHNTLALAEYRVRHWSESIAAAERSIALTTGVDAYNWFFLAMALWQRGEKDRSRLYFDRAVAWTKKNDPKNAELLAFWREAAGLLGRPGPDAPPLPDLPADVFAR